MCGRFTFNLSPELLAEIFGLTEPPSISSRFNIAPTQLVPVIRQLPDSKNQLDLLRWGLTKGEPPMWLGGYKISQKG